MKKNRKNKLIFIIIAGVILIFILLILIYFNTTYISKDKVKTIISDNMKVSSSEIYFESIELELDKNIYEVEIYYKNHDYEFKIDAKEGNIIYSEYNSYNINTNNNSNNIQNNNGNDSRQNNCHNTPAISIDEAKNIAINNANVDINNVKFFRDELDCDNHNLIYELEFYIGNIEYEYEIDANTGTIISYDKEDIYN